MGNLNIAILPTYNSNTMCVADDSIYETKPPSVISPTLEISVPGFAEVFIPFVPNSYIIINTLMVGLPDIKSLPDGIYKIKYTVDPAYANYVQKTFLRVDRLQEKFDTAFLTLELMECDGQVKKQSHVELNTIYLYIQGAIAAANNCSSVEAMTLYRKADSFIDRFLKKGCGCSGNNYS